MVARLGGDGFVVFVPGMAGDSACRKMAKRILERMREAFRVRGHTVHVSARVGIASYLPRVEFPPEHVSLAGSLPSPLLPGSATVLVVEDDPSVRDVAGATLELAGYTVLQARHGEEALSLSRGYGGVIELVLTDVVMPGLPATEMVAALRRERPETRILYVSGYAENTFVHHGVLDDGVAFLPKPYTPAALTARVRDTLGGPAGAGGA